MNYFYHRNSLFFFVELSKKIRTFSFEKKNQKKSKKKSKNQNEKQPKRSQNSISKNIRFYFSIYTKFYKQKITKIYITN